MPGTFQCIVVTPEAPILDHPVKHAVIPAWDGRIGLLPSHAPLLVKLGFGPISLDLEDNSRKMLFIGGGFAQMKDEVLTILTDEALDPNQINRTEVAAAFREAEARQPTSNQEANRRQRDLERARGLLAVAPQ